MNLFLHLPKGIKYHIRDDPLCPFEVVSKGLKRYKGNPVNVSTKKNKNLSEKYKIRRELGKDWKLILISLKRNIEFFSTYGGNPLAVTASSAVLDVI